MVFACLPKSFGHMNARKKLRLDSGKIGISLRKNKFVQQTLGSVLSNISANKCSEICRCMYTYEVNKGSSSKLHSKAEKGEETWKTVVAVLLREIESFTMRYGIASNLGGRVLFRICRIPRFPGLLPSFFRESE